MELIKLTTAINDVVQLPNWHYFCVKNNEIVVKTLSSHLSYQTAIEYADGLKKSEFFDVLFMTKDGLTYTLQSC